MIKYGFPLMIVGVICFLIFGAAGSWYCYGKPYTFGMGWEHIPGAYWIVFAVGTLFWFGGHLCNREWKQKSSRFTIRS